MKQYSTCPPDRTSAPTTDRSPMKDVRVDLLQAYISWKIYYEQACSTSTFEIVNLSAKDMTCDWFRRDHKTECDACVLFVNCPEMRI